MKLQKVKSGDLLQTILGQCVFISVVTEVTEYYVGRTKVYFVRIRDIAGNEPPSCWAFNLPNTIDLLKPKKVDTKDLILYSHLKYKSREYFE